MAKQQQETDVSAFAVSFLSFLENESTLPLFDPVRLWLANHETYSEFFRTVEFERQTEAETDRTLCRAIYLLVDFLKLENHELRENQEAKPRIRFPFRLLVDFRTEGALCYILGEMFTAKFEKCWAFFDLRSVTKRGETLQLLTRIEKCLIDKSLFIIPRIFFSGEVSQSLTDELTEIVRDHKGVIVETEVLASHIIHNKQQTVHNLMQREDNLKRLVFSSKEFSLVHQLFTPESFMQCLSNSQVAKSENGFNINAFNNAISKYHVDYSWLLTVKCYGEWVSELDFLTKVENSTEILSLSSNVFSSTDLGDINVSPSNGMGNETWKDKQNDGSEENIVVEIPETTAVVNNVTSPNVIQSLVQANVTLVDLDEEPTMSLASQSKRARLSLESNNKTNKETSILADQTFHIIIPSYSAWFEYESIHNIEKRALPEFFIDDQSEVKCPEKYLYLRNFMIDSYRINPFVHLSVTAVRRNLSGDVCTIFRVHAFLQQWGLINYQCEFEPKLTSTRALSLANPATFHVFGDIKHSTEAKLETNIEGKSVAEVKPNIKPVQIVRSLNSVERIAHFPESEDSTKNVSSSSRTNVYKVGNFGLHLDMYAAKKQKQQQSATTQGNASSTNATEDTSEWNQTEIFLLLEAIQIYEEDWEKIGEHVGTKTSEQCIAQFLKLPIEDSFLNESKTGQPSARLDPVPFASTPNPVMTTVAFLAREVDQRLAAEAAKGALDTLSRLATKRVLNCALQNDDAITMTSTHSEGPSSSIYSENEHDDGVSSSAASCHDFSDDLSSNKENIEISTAANHNEEISSSESIAEATVMRSVRDADIESRSITNDDYVMNPEEDPSSALANFVPTMQSLREAIDEYERLVINVETTDEETDQVEGGGGHVMTFEQMEAIHNTPIDRQMSLLATEAALKCSAEKAKHLKSLVERRIRVAVVSLVETQLKKLELKMKHFEELEAILEKERSEYEAKRKSIMEERQKYVLEQTQIMYEMQARQRKESTPPQQNANTVQVQYYPERGGDHNVGCQQSNQLQTSFQSTN